MVQSHYLKAVFSIVSILWVGGWGFLMFRHPEFFARLNTRFGLKWFSGQAFVSFTKKVGILEMGLALLSLILMLVGAALGLRWF